MIAHATRPNLFPRLLHGADYNPDQWLDRPDILDHDIAWMLQSGFTSVSLGIFSWTSYEPSEGRYQFAWLDAAFDRLHRAGLGVILATPSGGKPTWMSEAYPEIRRCRQDGSREPSGSRHNHCWTSPVYRRQVQNINRALAERYGQHPALLAWHISNEYGGDCHCPLCHAAFRHWLRRRYDSLDQLNQAWWTEFWSHRYTDWSQIAPVDGSVEGLVLDWRRFMNHQMVDFMRAEIAAVRDVSPAIPCTTNFMGTIPSHNYWEWAPHLDFISNDSYPAYSDRASNAADAASESLNFDLDRSLLQRPFILMESSPNQVNWHRVPRLKAPGLHRLEMLQSIAHGADGSHYFQWRKGRGGSEKNHGAVIDHANTTDTRTFREVAAHGELLRKLEPLRGAMPRAEIAVLYDWESKWALDCSGHKDWSGPELYGLGRYSGPVKAHYRALWNSAVSVDIVTQESDFDRYRILVAPTLYLLRPGTADRLRRFVENGGTLVSGFLTGVVGPSHLCHLNGVPGEGLRELFGLWVEEVDYLEDSESNGLRHEVGNVHFEGPAGRVRHICERLRVTDATVVARYTEDFYAGEPAITLKHHGKGSAWYLGCQVDDDYLRSFHRHLIQHHQVGRILDTDLPPGVTVQSRRHDAVEYIFVLNFEPVARRLQLPTSGLQDQESGLPLGELLELPPFGSRVLRRCLRS